MYSVYLSVLDLAVAEYLKLRERLIPNIKTKNYSSWLRLPTIRKIWSFHVVVPQRTATNDNERLPQKHSISSKKKFCMSTDVYFVGAKHEPHVLVSKAAIRHW